MKVTRKQIDSFFAPGKIAVAGTSADKKKFGGMVFDQLRQQGIEVIPVNPAHSEIDGLRCYPDVASLPGDVESVLIVTPPKVTDGVLRDCISKGIANIWVQNMSETAETIKIADEYQKEVVTGKCIFMFAEPVKGVHRFHRAIVKLFGGLPK